MELLVNIVDMVTTVPAGRPTLTVYLSRPR